MQKYKKYYELDLGRNYDTCDVHLKWIGHGMYFELEKTDLIHIVEELLKVNGKLYQRIGFEKEEKEDDKFEDDDNKEEIKIEDVIDEKGDLI